MRTIDLTKISADNLKEEHCETLEYFEYLLAEASPTRGLAFFNISYDKESKTLTIPDEIDLAEAIEVVNEYLAIVEEEIAPMPGRAVDYDRYTRPFRGADDGTFDYAGTFVISILCVIQAHFN